MLKGLDFATVILYNIIRQKSRINFAEGLYNIAFFGGYMNIFENHSFADPRVPFIFHNYSFPASFTKNSRLNWHENIEILYFKSGVATVKAGSEDIKVSSGDIIIINPNLLHGVIEHTKIDFYCLIIDRSFCLANYVDTNTTLFNQCIRDNGLSEELEGLASAFFDDKKPFRHLALRSSVLRILSILCARHSLPKSTQSGEIHLLSAIKHALGYIYSESNRPLSLDDIADVSGLSKYYLAHEFKRLTGHTVINYLGIVRCEKAAELLVSNTMSVEGIALECGFSSSSYFIKAFKKYYGLSPGEYRNRFYK